MNKLVGMAVRVLFVLALGVPWHRATAQDFDKPCDQAAIEAASRITAISDPMESVMPNGRVPDWIVQRDIDQLVINNCAQPGAVDPRICQGVATLRAQNRGLYPRDGMYQLLQGYAGCIR